MSIAFLIIILLFLLWPWYWPKLRAIISRFMAHRAEDMMRRMMGMPSRAEEKKRRKKARKEEKQFRHSHNEDNPYRTSRHYNSRSQSMAEMMQDVAVDVEYVEIKETIIPETSSDKK